MVGFGECHLCVPGEGYGDVPRGGLYSCTWHFFRTFLLKGIHFTFNFKCRCVSLCGNELLSVGVHGSGKVSGPLGYRAVHGHAWLGYLLPRI